MTDDTDRGDVPSDRLEAVAEEVRRADAAVAFTGAGVSTASGVPAFRTEGGVWERFDQRDFHLRRFETDPAGFWRDRVELHEAMFPGDVAPNPAHHALADLESAGALDAVVTQNTDGLHAAAGSANVVELHGNASRVVCLRCGHRRPAEVVHERVREGDVPPHCEECGLGVYKPDVVLFGEQLPLDAFGEARRLARESDVFLVAGSSLQVEPAASLPTEVGDGGTLVVVNLEETPYSGEADVAFRADVTDVLPALAARVVGSD
ncbi:MAG: Sir2 family NAD-dependent protein deacetylase [Haloferacaceae archaeon]